MRLIDADTIVHYQTYDDEREEFHEHKSTIADFLDGMTDEGCPNPVDAVPAVHSEWIPKEKADTPYGLEMECAKCGFPVIVNDALYFKFCPHCGARINGDNG